GFFSKDEILWKAWSTHAFHGTGLGMWYGKLIWLVGACAAACTAFYMTRLVIKTFLDRPKWGTAQTAFSGGGLPDWMDEEEKKKQPKKEPKKGTGPDGMPAWMEDDAVGSSLPEDESMLDLGPKRKPKKEEPKQSEPAPANLEDETHPVMPSNLLQDESMLDLGAVGRKASHGHEDHGHAADLPDDPSLLDMGKVGSHGAPAHDSHDAHDAHA